MNDNKKVLGYFVGVLVTFIVASLFHYVIGWGAGVAITICALANLFFLSAPQSVERRMPVPLRAVLLVLALIVGFVFGVMFLSWTMLAIYLACIVAGSLIAIVRA